MVLLIFMTQEIFQWYLILFNCFLIVRVRIHLFAPKSFLCFAAMTAARASQTDGGGVVVGSNVSIIDKKQSKSISSSRQCGWFKQTGVGLKIVFVKLTRLTQSPCVMRRSLLR